MAKTRSKGAPASAHAALARSSAPGWHAQALGALVLATSATSIVPAFAAGALERTRSIAVLIIAALWLIAWAAGLVRFWGRQRWWLGGFAAVAVALLASAAFAPFPLSELMGGLSTGMGAVQWLALLVVAAGASGTLLGACARRWLSAVYIWVVPAALLGLWQALAHQPVSGGLLNRDLFGLVLLVWLGPAFGLLATARSTGERAAWGGVAALLAAAVFASGARAASAGVVLEAGLFAALAGGVVLPAARTALRWGGGVVAALAGVAVAGVTAFAAVGGEGAAAWLARVVPGMQTRAYLYASALQVFRSHPLLGAGPDGYQLASQPYVQPALLALEHGNSFVDTTAADPHSIALRLLAGLGVIGWAAVCFAIAGWVIAIRDETAQSEQAGALRISLAIGVAGFALASLTSPWPLTIGASPVLAIGLAAAAFTRDGRAGGGGTAAAPAPASSLPLPPAALAAARWIVALALSALFGYVAVAGAANYATFTSAVGASDPSARLALLQSARDQLPWDSASRFQALWAQGTMFEQGQGSAAAFHAAVDADPLAAAYAPQLAEFVRESLANADLTNRRDISWERAKLAQAALAGPSMPSVASEQLHLALLSGDKDAIASALDAATGVAEADPEYAAYVTQARKMLGK